MLQVVKLKEYELQNCHRCIAKGKLLKLDED